MRGQLHARSVGGVHERGEHGQVVGAVRDGVAVEAEELGRGVDRVGDQAARDHLQRMQAVREGGRDAEVAAAAAQRPEEVGVGRLGHVEHLAVGVDELDGQQVVGREAVLRHQPAEPAAEREPGDARRRDRAAGDGEPVLGRGAVELRPRETALGPHCAGLRVDLGALHLGEVDHHRVVGDRAAGHVVAAAADADVEPGGACEAHAGSHVGRASAADDHGRRPVDEAVVDPARRVVAVVRGAQDTPGDAAGEVVEECGVRRHGTAPMSVMTCPMNASSLFMSISVAAIRNLLLTRAKQ